MIDPNLVTCQWFSLIIFSQRGDKKMSKKQLSIGLIVLLVALVAAQCGAQPMVDTSAIDAANATATAEVEAAIADAEAVEPTSVQPSTASSGRSNESMVVAISQAVSILNPYLSRGDKDVYSAAMVLEPLANFDPNGELVPTLAEEIPTLENGGIAEDLKSITWKLKKDVLWSDGTPFTAADVVFTYEYCVNPDMGCSSPNYTLGIEKVEALDDYTVKLSFTNPVAFPYDPFTTCWAPIVQKAQYENCTGADAQGCSTENTYPIGTGPYKVADFRVNDVVVFERNENFREPDKPYFQKVTFKGGGDSVSTARLVLETGEADLTDNLTADFNILQDMEKAGKGVLVSRGAGASMERLVLNFTNPDPALGEKRSVWSVDDPNPNPHLSDSAVRRAMSMAIDRETLAMIFGPYNEPTCNFVSGPEYNVSHYTDPCLKQDIEGAKQLLEEAGWVDSDGDGVREKNGVRLSLLYQTSTNALRQKVQALVKQWWQEIGIETELRNIDAAVHFGNAPSSPDTTGRFYADVQEYMEGPRTPDPQTFLSKMTCFGGDNIVTPVNNWVGNNAERWCNAEYDALWEQLAQTADPAERSRTVIALNDMLYDEVVGIPIVNRTGVYARSTSLDGFVGNPWDGQYWNAKDYKRVLGD
jgi:peptide/nickel transport system substrate-binding protein